MTKNEAINKIEKMVVKAIEIGDYNLIREATEIAYDFEIEMAFDDEWVTVEDEMFYFNGAF